MKVTLFGLGGLILVGFLISLTLGGPLPADTQARIGLGAVQINGFMAQVDPDGRIFGGCVADQNGGLFITVTNGWFEVPESSRQENAESMSEDWRRIVGSYAPVYFIDRRGHYWAWADNGDVHYYH